MLKSHWQSLVRQRWLLVVTAVLTAYTLAGFCLLPWWLQRYVTHTLAERWQQPVQLTAVRFNPFQLRLELDGFSLAGSDGSPLLAFSQFVLDYRFLSSFRGEAGVEQLLLEQPVVVLEANGQGGYLLLDILAKGFPPAGPDSPTPPPAEAAPAPLLAAWLQQLAIREGRIEYRDARRGDFRETLHLQELRVEDFHTRGGEHGNRVVLALRHGTAGSVQLDTRVLPEPLQVTGTLAVQALDLAPVWQWLQQPVAFHLQAPQLALQAGFTLSLPQALQVSVQDASLELRDLALSRSPQEPVLVRLPYLGVKGVQLDLTQQRVEVAEVLATDGWLDVVMDKAGNNNLQALFAPPATPAATAPADPAAPVAAPATAAALPPAPVPPWDVRIQQLSLERFTVQYRDEQPAEPFVLTLAPLAVWVRDWKPLAAERFPLTVTTAFATPALAQAGSAAVNLQVQLVPFALDGTVSVQQFALPAVQPYAAQFVKATLHYGLLNAELALQANASEALQLGVQGRVEVQSLDVHEPAGERKLLSWDTLALEGLDYRLQAPALSVGTVSITKLNTAFVIKPDGTTNVHELLVPQPAPAAPSPPLSIAIGTIRMQDADIGFSDLTLKPNFRVAMQQLSGDIQGLSSAAGTHATIKLRGKVDRYAPVTITGRFNPLLPKPMLDARMAFKNLELTTFTPYSGTYAGFKIEKGQLSIDLDYKLVNDRVQGKNHIVMNQLQLGENVQSPRAIDLPVRLAIALLRDENGVIDLGFEVSGDLNDPQFSVGGLIWKVLGNMIRKAVTAPFSLVAGLLGGESGDADQVAFAPGAWMPDEAAHQKIQTAGSLLQKRSMVHLDIQGNVLPEQDRPALQKQRLLQALQEGNTIPAEAFLSAQAAQDNGKAYRQLARYYEQQRNDELGDVQDRLRDDMKARGETADRKTLQRLAYEQAWQRLQDAMPVSEEDLRQLAMQRARQVKAEIVEHYGIAADRVFVLDALPPPEQASLSVKLSLDAR